MKRANGMGTIYKLSGNRRRPYIVRVTVGWDIDVDSEKSKIKLLTIGYAATQQEAVKMLNEYNEHPYSIEDAKITFADVYERWSKDKFPIISESNIKGYSASYKCCEALYDRPFRELKLIDLQGVIDSCNKNYPTLRKLRVLLNQMYDYAMRYEICNNRCTAVADKRKRNTCYRHYSHRHADILKHLEKEHSAQSRYNQHSILVACIAADAEYSVYEESIKRYHSETTQKTKLFPDNREYEIRFSYRQILKRFLSSLKKPFAGESAGADGYL